MIEELVRQVKFYVVRCDRCDALGGEAEAKEAAILQAQENGFVMEPQWNGTNYAFTVFCAGCYAKTVRREGLG